VATLEPLTAAELNAALVDWRAALTTGDTDGRPSRKGQLRELHDLLLRATPSSSRPPAAVNAVAAEVVASAAVRLVDSLAPRPRVAIRLLRAGAVEAAWAVLTDNAAGLVDDHFHRSTATGSARSSGRRPLRALIEAPRVFARLSGFRDPRFAAPDDCYDITDAVNLRHQLDEIEIDPAGTVTMGGWACLDVVTAGTAEDVRLVLVDGRREIAATGVRLRRADLVSGQGEGLLRRAWAGWSVSFEAGAAVGGTWELWLELDHDGVVRRVPIGTEVSEIAKAAARGTTQVAEHSLSWTTSGTPWRLTIEARRPTQWGGVLRRTSL
jgi:hypothetical protein